MTEQGRTPTVVSTSKTIYTAGEVVTINLSTTDRDKLPLTGGDVTLTITPPKGNTRPVTVVLKTNEMGKASYVKTTYRDYLTSTAKSSFQLR